MKRLSWRESASAVAPPRLKVERFLGRGKHRVHLIGELRCKKVHHKFKENTRPCAEPEPCALCSDNTWKSRLEYYAPALVKSEEERLWVPIVAVFTPGGFNHLKKFPPGAYRGRLLDVWRNGQGNAGGGVLLVKEVSRIDPCVPPFDVTPHLLRLWDETAEGVPPAQMPAGVPFTDEEVETIKPVPTLSLPPSPEERAKAQKLLRARLGREQTDDEATPTSAAAPAATSPPTSPPAAPAAAPQPTPVQPRPVLNGKHHPPAEQPDEPGELSGVVDGLVNRFTLGDDPLRVDGDIDQYVYGKTVQRGPKVAVYVPPSAEDDEQALTQRTGSIVCGDYKDKSFLKNGSHKTAGKGGAK